MKNHGPQSIQQKRRDFKVPSKDQSQPTELRKSNGQAPRKTRNIKENLVGLVLGKLTVLGTSHQDKYGRWHYLCRCECGKEVSFPKNNLIRERRNCFNCKPTGGRPTHGMRNSPEYQVWNSMKQRCRPEGNQKRKEFAHYAGRGIAVSESWNSFENFFQDMGLRPSPLHQIDRIDNNGGYSKDNCRWASRETNQSNRSDSNWWVVKGLKFNSGADAARHFGVSDVSVCRWVYGYTDKRRGTKKPPKQDSYLIKKYDNS